MLILSETPNLLELVEAHGANARTLADLSTCDDEATDSGIDLSSGLAGLSLCGDEGSDQ
jgi:hypothetical protein